MLQRKKKPSKEEFHDAKNDMEQDEVVLEENSSQFEYDIPESEEEDIDEVVPIHMIRVYHDSDNTDSDYASSIEEYYEMECDPNMSRNKDTTKERIHLWQSCSDEKLIENTLS